MMFENFDLTNIVMPVDYDKLGQLLSDTNYDKAETDYLIDGYKNGFSIGYEGPEEVVRESPNLKFTIGNEVILWNKVMKEVREKRYAGPFVKPPFPYYIQSPIGLVPKDNGKDVRLIFHLSYPRKPISGDKELVNANTLANLCSIMYCDFDMAVQCCIQEGVGCKISKSDMTAAFRQLGIKKKHWKFLLMKARNPVNKVFYYFVDKCLPFGSSISCAQFQAVSDAIAHILTVRVGKLVINYLDDYLFISYVEFECNRQVKIFMEVCALVKLPTAEEKTFWATTRLVFLGLMLDTDKQLVLLPKEKIVKGQIVIANILSKKKIILCELQQLTGFLNFLGRGVTPSRAFTRRLYAYTKGVLKPHHHIRINAEMRLDLQVWLIFLHHPTVFARPFIDSSMKAGVLACQVNMYSDASRNYFLGYGAICQESWQFRQWDPDFMEEFDPSIEYLGAFCSSGRGCHLDPQIFKQENYPIL